MANPFGIEQVNIPSLLGLHSQMKQQRLEDLYKAKEYEIKAKEAERADRKDAALARITSKGGGQASGTGGATAPNTQAPSASPIPESGPLPPRTDGVTINQQALNEYAMIDPKAAGEIRKFVYDGDEQTLKAATARGEAMAAAADAISRVPPEQRAAELQRWSGWLVDHGLPKEEVAKADLTDAGLARYYKQGMTLKDIIAGNKPDVRVLPPGATLYDMKSNRTTATNTNAPPATLPADFDFADDGGPTPPASGGF